MDYSDCLILIDSNALAGPSCCCPCCHPLFRLFGLVTHPSEGRSLRRKSLDSQPITRRQYTNAHLKFTVLNLRASRTLLSPIESRHSTSQYTRAFQVCSYDLWLRALATHKHFRRRYLTVSRALTQASSIHSGRGLIIIL